MEKKKQDWSPREGPLVHVEIRFDMRGLRGEFPYSKQQVEELLTRLLDATNFEETLKRAFEDAHMPVEILDGEVYARRMKA